MFHKALHLLLMLSTLSFGLAEAVEETPFAADSISTISMVGEVEHQHHEAESHAEGTESNCSQCCHLSLNALPRCETSVRSTPSNHQAVSTYARRLITQTPLTPFRPPIS